MAKKLKEDAVNPALAAVVKVKEAMALPTTTETAKTATDLRQQMVC